MIVALIVFTAFITARARAVPIISISGNSLPAKAFLLAWYHKNGSKSFEFPYLHGKKHGTSIDYYEDGSKKHEFTSLNGRTHGTAVDYQEDGSRAIETLYENGNEISRKEF
tara:strand:- start:387 stop:719 length:333 start_codon:yes stop_codon:yes gene_type:complete